MSSKKVTKLVSLEDKCWDAFENKDYEKAVCLLPLVKKPKDLARGILEVYNASLIHLSSQNGWLHVTKDLITKYHCNPHERDSKRQTCFHYAAASNHVHLMRYLIDECHCNPMAVDRDGWTPLHLAAYSGKSAAVEYLLSTGKCDPLAKSNGGDTPFKLAKGR
ncbi:PREDICTED: 26S proteasome non-ATPase regulatory subunit 10-like, partial [Amphimedon queenslandica]